LYVLALDVPANRLVVGPRAALAATTIDCTEFRAGVPDFPPIGPDPSFAPAVTARIRHRHRGVPVAAWRRDGERCTVELAAPVDGVAPGQGLVLYAADVVLGGGRIGAPGPAAGEAGSQS
jgi:tRNA-specific 2-thiouridylase